MIPRFISCQQLVAAKGLRSEVSRVALGATGGRFGPPVFKPPTHPEQQVARLVSTRGPQVHETSGRRLAGELVTQVPSRQGRATIPSDLA